MIPIHDLHYAAGFFDGEGSCTVQKPNKRTPYYVMIRVDIGQVQKEVLEWFRSKWGGNIYLRNVGLNRSKQVNYQWTISGQSAANFLNSIIPFLKVKQDTMQDRVYQWEHRLDRTTLDKGRKLHVKD